MLESEILQRCIKRTQKEWQQMSLEEKKDKVIEYLQNRFDDTEIENGKYNYSRLIMCVDMAPKKEAKKLVEEIHKSIMEHALQLKKEAQEREGGLDR